MTFVHLHVHTEYSVLDGAARLGPLVAEARRLGMPALAMTDHGSVSGAFDFYRKATAAEIKPIIGVEAYVAPGSRHHMKPVLWGRPSQRKSDPRTGLGGDVSHGGSYLHLTLLAENADGLRNLFRLTSLASRDGFYNKPRMDLDLLAQYASGLIATSGCPSGAVQTRLRLGQPAEALREAGDLQDIFGKENFFLELMEHGLPIERVVRKDLLEIGRKLGIAPVATNDSHYVTADQADLHDNLLCVSVREPKNAPNRFRFEGDGYYLKNAEEMRALWDGQVPGACDNTLLIADRVGDYGEVFAHRDLMPRFDVPAGHSADSWLRTETERGMRARYGDRLTQEMVERAEYELGVIAKMGFSGYFLVVADICRHARDTGIALGPGRGSVTGSLVAYAVRISELDPIGHGLMFERFLNPDRVTPPDVDLDFDDSRRGDMVRYVTEKYGSERCSQILTLNRIGAKAAVKDACRVLDLPPAKGDSITKMFPRAIQGNEITLAAIFDADDDRYGEAEKLRHLYQVDEDARTVLNMARGLEGFIRSTSVHPAGVILSAEPLMEVLPLTWRPDDGAVIGGFTFGEVEDLGLLKMDFLGLRNLTILARAVPAIKQRLGVNVDLEALPLDDAATFDLLARGDTLGMFQLDSAAMQALLRMIRPTQFEDLSAALALYRPGPMAAKAHTNYALRKNGEQPITPLHPELANALEPILSETYGLVVYQEQVMAIAQAVAGYTLAQADLLRRAMGKKKKSILDAEMERFVGGMLAGGYSKGAAKKLWDTLLPFAAYAFNKSHTAGYALLSYRTAWLKAHYPAEYMAATLSTLDDQKDRSALYLAECRRMGLKVLPPDANTSLAHYTAVDDHTIRFGLSAVRDVGDGAVASILASRQQKGSFVSFGDFLAKVDATACNKKVLRALIKAGAFDSLGHPRQGLMSVHEQAGRSATTTKKAQSNGMVSLFDDDEEFNAVDVPDVEWDRDTRMAMEREVLGLYVSDHPLAGLEDVLARHRSISIADLLAAPEDEQPVQVCGLVTDLEQRTSKSGRTWMRVQLEDLSDTIEVTLFGSTHDLYAAGLAKDSVIMVDGKVRLHEGKVSVSANDVSVFDVDARPGPVVLELAEQRLTPDLVKELGRILEIHPGETPVYVHVSRQGRPTTVMDLPRHRVETTPALYADLKSLLGLYSVRQAGTGHIV